MYEAHAKPHNRIAPCERPPGALRFMSFRALPVEFSTTFNDGGFPVTELSTTEILEEAERALNTARRFKYSSRKGFTDSYDLVAELGRALQTYTVILLYPDYATDDYGRDCYIGAVEASNPDVAVVLARSRAYEETAPASAGDDADNPIRDPDDFAVVAVFRGRFEAEPLAQ